MQAPVLPSLLTLRYLKETWRDTEVAGLAVWFRVHQLCMGLCLVCTLIGVILIASDRGLAAYENWDLLKKNPHPGSDASFPVDGNVAGLART